MISEELMPMAWNPKKWLDWCLSEEKSNRHNFYWRVLKVCVGSIKYGGLETFCLLTYWNILRPKFIKICPMGAKMFQYPHIVYY